MSRLLIILLTLCVASFALANDFTAERQVAPKSDSHVLQNPGTPDGRQGGEDIASAFAITALPFSDAGNTVNNIDDYDEVCPYSGSTSPDVVYSFTATAYELMMIDLCYSSYDTKVFVYADGWTPGLPYACNDDFWTSAPCYTFSSYVEAVVEPGHTYYIVVDGYGGDAGDYVIDITSEPYVPCVDVTCAPSAVDEGEPPLAPDYNDVFNGGCNAEPPVFQAGNWIDETGCLHMRGSSGWYPYTGLDYRDTDWIEVIASGTEMTVKYEAANDVTLNGIGVSIPNPDCTTVDWQVLDFAVEGCNEVEYTVATEPGAHYWIVILPADWVTTTAEYPYCLEVCGITYDVVPTEGASWGTVKSMYR